jgi:hypothetical protein
MALRPFSHGCQCKDAACTCVHCKRKCCARHSKIEQTPSEYLITVWASDELLKTLHEFFDDLCLRDIVPCMRDYLIVLKPAWSTAPYANITGRICDTCHDRLDANFEARQSVDSQHAALAAHFSLSPKEVNAITAKYLQDQEMQHDYEIAQQLVDREMKRDDLPKVTAKLSEVTDDLRRIYGREVVAHAVSESCKRKLDTDTRKRVTRLLQVDEPYKSTDGDELGRTDEPQEKKPRKSYWERREEEEMEKDDAFVVDDEAEESPNEDDNDDL